MIQQRAEFAHRDIDRKQSGKGKLGVPDAEQALGEFNSVLRIERAEPDHREFRLGRNGEIPGF
ncbi:hypothetical protein D3C76_1749060 [compost metagenome]